MTHRIDTPSPSDWDAFVRAHPRGHILQMSEWGAHRAAFGWRDERVAVTAATDEARILGGALLLFRPLPARLGTMAYLAMAPLIHPDYARDPQVESALWRGIDTAARRHRAVFIKWEPGVFIDGKPGVFIDGKPGVFIDGKPGVFIDGK
ncbi:MAG: peptidoglycan bridge formation glycyltransferase FemA/FemB family protein, partial [Chloroflexota bacterium]|nr:peptidoglycan bridge formation glycyltransferase FemA/FemB family protein [Chloroflexota bacterium]